MVLGDWPRARLDTRLLPGMMQCLSDRLAADHGRAAPLRAFTPNHCYHMSQLSHERDPRGPWSHGTAGLPRAPPPGGLLPHLPGGAKGFEPLTPCQQGRGEGQAADLGEPDMINLLHSAVSPAGNARAAQGLIGSTAKARVLADGADGPPAGRAANAVRNSEDGPDAYDAFRNEDVIALQFLRVAPGALAHVDRVYPGGDEFLGHVSEVDQPGRVLAETDVVGGEPADQEVHVTQTELGGDRLVSCV